MWRGSPGRAFHDHRVAHGQVHFRVERHDKPPGLDEGWEEVVEASFSPASAVADLVEWAGGAHWPLALGEASLRVRYCAKGMDAARALDTALEGESRTPTDTCSSSGRAHRRPTG